MKKIIIWLFLFFWIMQSSYAYDYESTYVWINITWTTIDVYHKYDDSLQAQYTNVTWYFLKETDQGNIFATVAFNGWANWHHVVWNWIWNWSPSLFCTRWYFTLSNTALLEHDEDTSITQSRVYYDPFTNDQIIITDNQSCSNTSPWNVSTSNIANPAWTPINTLTTNLVTPSWPPDLAFTATGEIVPIQDGFTMSGAIVNQDYRITNIDIYEYEYGTALLTDSDLRVVSITWSGWVEIDLDILNDADFTFDAFQDYEIKITLERLDSSQSIFQWYTYWDYNYNAWYTEPDPWTFSYNVSWYTFFENWFTLNNFVPDPYGWWVYFEIIAPSPTWTGTIELTTERYYNAEVDWNGYWFDRSVNVTYPYHQVAWTYQVRTVYEYDNVTDYPFGTDYNSYEITLAEIPNDEEFDIDFIDVNFFDWVVRMFDGIKDFFRELMRIWEVEQKQFWFMDFLIPSTHADSVMWEIVFNTNEWQDNILTDLKAFLKWFVIFAFLILSVILIIVINKKD